MKTILSLIDWLAGLNRWEATLLTCAFALWMWVGGYLLVSLFLRGSRIGEEDEK